MDKAGSPPAATGPAALFGFPASDRISPDAEAARRHTIRWLSRYGVFQGDESVAEYDALRFDLLAAHFYPGETGSDLALGNDLCGWYFVFDDQFDGELGCRPEEVSRLVDAVVRVTEEPEEPAGRAAEHAPGGPLVESFRDLWRRIHHGMPRVWRDRFRRHWTEYLRSYHHEAVGRTGSRPRSVEAVVALRRHSIGVQPCLDLNERFGGYALPEAVHDGFPLAQLRKATDEVVVFTNDIVSLAKELAAGDVHNSVLVQRELAGGTLEEAVRHIARLADARYRWFEDTAARLPTLLPGVGADTRRHVAHYVDGMRQVMRGNLAWSFETARYDERGIAAVSRGRERPWAGLAACPTPVS